MKKLLIILKLEIKNRIMEIRITFHEFKGTAIPFADGLLAWNAPVSAQF